MKKLYFIIAFLGYISSLFSKQVPFSKANTTAHNFVYQSAGLQALASGSYQLNLVKTEKVSVNNQTLNSYYIFNISSGGFIIVSADDVTTPILGYSTESSFDMNKMPSSIESYFTKLNEGIKEAIRLNTQSAEAKQEWDNYSTSTPSYKNGNNGSTNISAGVGPYVTTKWDQDGGYQKFCPAYTGCVGTAFAQILKYYNHPAVGKGYKAYSNKTYGTIAANFGATPYKWSSMPNQLTSTSATYEIDAIATLMYHAGVSIDMEYTPDQSLAYTYKVVSALKNTFSYANTAQILDRSNYNLQSWTNLIKTELDAKRIVMHSGMCPNPEAGHAFVMDGYDANGLYHVNWGWGGYMDGYFQLSTLNTGTYTWNDDQELIIGIKPAPTPGYKLSLATSVISSTSVLTGQTITVNAKVKNSGAVKANGNFMAALFNDKNMVVSKIQILSNKTVLANSTSSFTFSMSSLNVLPGTYKLGIYFSTSTNVNGWQLVAQGSYTNPKSMKVKTNNPLLVNSSFTYAPNPFVQNDSCMVAVNIKNSSTYAFTGDLKASLYTATGIFKKEIQIKSGATIAAGDTMNCTFKLSSLSLSSGTYFIAIQSKAINNSTYNFLNAAISLKPTQAVIVKEQASSGKLDMTIESQHESNLPDFIVYPNPVSNEIHINTSTQSQKTIVLTNINGTIVREFVSYDETEIKTDVSDLTNGIYFITVKENGIQKTQKIIKQ